MRILFAPSPVVLYHGARMRAAVFSEHGGPEVIRIAEVEEPEPGPGDVRIAVRAASLNHLDLWARRGLPFEIPMPHIGGSDVAGEVFGKLVLVP